MIGLKYFVLGIQSQFCPIPLCLRNHTFRTTLELLISTKLYQDINECSSVLFIIVYCSCAPSKVNTQKNNFYFNNISKIYYGSQRYKQYMRDKLLKVFFFNGYIYERASKYFFFLYHLLQGRKYFSFFYSLEQLINTMLTL